MADPRPERRLRDALNEQREGEAPRDDLEIPIGRGRLNVMPTVNPGASTDIEGGVEFPVGAGGSVGAHGFVRKYHYDGPRQYDAGAGVQFKQKFEHGGVVKHGSLTRVTCRNK